MTKSELVANLTDKLPHLTSKDVDFAVNLMLDAIAEALTQGDRVEIRGFGSFSLNFRPARQGRNPKTGEQVEVAAKHVPHFKAGKELRERVQQAAEDAAQEQRLRQAA